MQFSFFCLVKSSFYLSTRICFINQDRVLDKGRYSEFEAFTKDFPCVSGNPIATELAKNAVTFNFCQLGKLVLIMTAILLSYAIRYYYCFNI